MLIVKEVAPPFLLWILFRSRTFWFVGLCVIYGQPSLRSRRPWFCVLFCELGATKNSNRRDPGGERWRGRRRWPSKPERERESLCDLNKRKCGWDVRGQEMRAAAAGRPKKGKFPAQSSRWHDSSGKANSGTHSLTVGKFFCKLNEPEEVKYRLNLS